MKRNLFAVLALLTVLAAPAQAQITITYTFVNGTTADADQVNTNFSQVSSAALNRAGGTITGNITVSAAVTIDGVDIGAVLGGTGSPTFAGVTITGTGASALDVAGGLNVGTGNVALVDTTGKIPAIASTYFASLSAANLTGIPAAELTGILPALNAAALTNLDAADLTGTIADARLSSNIPRLDGAAGTGVNTFSGLSTLTTTLGNWLLLEPNGNNLYLRASGLNEIKIGDITANPVTIGGGGGAVTIPSTLIASSMTITVLKYANAPVTGAEGALFTNSNKPTTPGGNSVFGWQAIQLNDGSTAYFPVWK